ncbi:MAG TPA: M20 aminoacylase family protein [Rhodospirillales bacterium]|nr:M20 aminoacylase family protein [Rhodospirillales bacterium]
MPVINHIAEFHADMTAWRRDFHAHPETAFEEKRTSDVVASKLEEFGIEVHRGLAETGVIGTLATGEGPSIGLRADIDALDVEELNDFDYKSRRDGKMHACGHDGHMTMLLGAARYLSETRNFKGTVHFIFQPAEENEGGSRVMVEQGLFDKFPVEAVYGMHNWPGMELGAFAVTEGPLMAAFDIFELTIKGRGSHGGMPHTGIDPIPVAAEIVSALQTIPSRGTDPQDSVVVSVTQIHAGHAWNVIPDDVVLRGTTRSFRPEVQDGIEPSIRRIAGGICQAHNCKLEMMYERRYPPTINEANAARAAARAAADVSGADKIVANPTPSMGAEDFAFMLNEKPGCYVWLGNGPGEGGCMLHNPHYDFNDDILTVGASYWARLVELELG